MNPLLPPTITTIVVTCLLIVIGQHMYRHERDKALLTWTIAWGVYLLRQLGAILSVYQPENTGLHGANHALTLAFCFLLFKAAREWARVVIPRVWIVILWVGLLWIAAAEWVSLPHLASAIPVSLISAATAFFAGITMLRSPRRRHNLGATMTSWGMIVWSLHTLDHPLSWEIEWYLPWDYELDAFFALYIAMSIWLLYYGETRQTLKAGDSSYDSLVSSIPTLFWQMNQAQPRQALRPPQQDAPQLWDHPSHGSDWAESIHPDDFQRFMSESRTAMDKREPFSLEYRLRSKDGEFRWVKDDGAPTFDSRGNYTGYVGAATDITLQKENEARLVERERRLAVLFEQSADAIFVADPSGRLIQVNEQACRSTGYTRDELLTMYVFDLDTNTTTAEDFAAFVASFSESRSRQVTASHRRKDGTTFPVEVRVSLIESDQGQLLIGTARDLTERVESDIRNAQIMKTAIDGFWLVDRSGRLVEANATAAESLGYTLEEFLQLSVFDIDADERPEDSHERIQTILEKGHLRFEARHRRKDGTLIDVEVSVSHHPQLQGHLFTFIRDITERKRAEEALRTAAEFLNRSQAAGHIGSWELDWATGRVRCSVEFLRIFDQNTDVREIDARLLFASIHRDDWKPIRKLFFRSLRSMKRAHECEFRIVRPGDGDIRIVHTRYELVHNETGQLVRTLGVVQDITDRKRQERVSAARLRLVEFASQGHSSHELLQTFLDEAEQLTESTIGFFHFVEPDQETLSLQAWSTNTLAHMCTAEGAGQHYPISRAGVWVDCVREGRPVIHNDYAGLQHKKGLPEGHAPIVRQLVVPVFRSGQVVAILGVGNKPANYGDYDRDMIVELADIAWDTVVRMRAEEALQATQAKFSKAFWDAPFLMTLGSFEDGRYLEANDAFYRVTGFTPAQAVGVTPTELGLISDDDRKRVGRLLRIEGEVRDMELELCRADGSKITTLYSGVLLDVGGTRQILSTALDITRRKQAEHKLIQAYDLLERSNEAARIGHWEISLANLDLSWSRVASEIFGLAPGTPVRLEQWLGFYEEGASWQKMTDTVNSAFSAGHAFEHESVVVTARGEKRFVRTTGMPVKVDGRCERMYGLFQDVTERRLFEQELQRQHRAITLTKNMTSVFLTSSEEDVFNDLLEVVRNTFDSRFGLFGYINDEGDLACPALSQVLWTTADYANEQAVFPRASWAGIWGRALLESHTVVQNEKLHVPEGHLHLDNAIATPLIHQGNAIGLFVLANRLDGYGPDEINLLESAALQTAPVLNAYLERTRKEQEHERLEAQFRQAQKMEAIGQLTGGVAHDFNNLLQIIIGYSDILLLHNIAPEQTRELLEQIAAAGHRAARLVSQLLLFSRRQIMRPEPLNLNETTSDLMKMLGRIIGEHVQVRWHPAAHLDYICADRSMIEQTLTNLCVNARDAMPDGGTVTIETQAVTLSAEQCASNPEATPGDYVLLSVTDTGCGMSEETVSRIFEPFFTTKAVGKGTGLGLATVYGIVKQHNGVIDVQSKPGEGSTFKLYWPVQSEGVLPPEIDTPEEIPAGGSETVLLAEDDEAVRVLVKQVLEGAGYTVVTANDGSHALDVLKDYPGHIDLAILDVVMPNMGGHEAYQKMRAEHPDLKAFFASGYSEDAIHKNFVLEDGLTLIQKPYTQKDLLRTVREVLSRN